MPAMCPARKPCGAGRLPDRRGLLVFVRVKRLQRGLPVSAAALTAAAVLGAAAGLSGSPPIQNPGAPGQDSREITAQTSVAMSHSAHTRADVAFMRHMIVHHAQAVEMNALIAERTDTALIRRLGERIALTQQAEIDFMRRWLAERDENTDMAMAPGGHAGHDGAAGDVAPMPGMLTPNQMAALAAADGARFDRLFLEGMILHHRGAIDMVEALLAEPGNGEDARLSEFLTHVTADQAAEILRMRSMLSDLSDGHGDEEEALRP